MKAPSVRPVRCAIYTRVSTEHGLDQEFNSLDAQYDAASAYIKSQAHAGWTLVRSRYDDGGILAGPPTDPTFRGCWTISVPARSTSSLSTKSTA
jgi:site-specific DNA recombinase